MQVSFAISCSKTFKVVLVAMAHHHMSHRRRRLEPWAEETTEPLMDLVVISVSLAVLAMALEVRPVISATELAVQLATELVVRPATNLAVRLVTELEVQLATKLVVQPVPELAVQPVTVFREANFQARLPFSRMQRMRKDCSKTAIHRSFVAQHPAAQ
jgi:hypothetical protein